MKQGAYLLILIQHLILLDHLPADLAAVVDDGIHLSPGAELALPVGDGGQGRDDEEWPPDPQQEYFVEERDGLDGLPQAHLIRQDAVLSEEQDTFDQAHLNTYRSALTSMQD